jgi:integrase
MATARQRTGGNWEFTVKRKSVLPKPLSFTFDTYEEGEAYCMKLEAMLDKGIIPQELQERTIHTMDQVIDKYEDECHMSQADKEMMSALRSKVQDLVLGDVNYAWAENWVKTLKRTHKLSPARVRHYVGALARVIDWGGKRYPELVINPMRMLPKGYSAYTPADIEESGERRDDEERDRRLEAGEEEAIRKVLAGENPDKRQKPPGYTRRVPLTMMFEMALETAMRMREMYTLTKEQVDLGKRTVFLDKTKNGDKRQVPMSSVLLPLVETYIKDIPDGGLVFPFWNGDSTPKGLRSTTTKLSQQWGRIFETAGFGDLHFHDLRHEATSRIFERTTLDPISISRITGHKDPRMLRRYSNLRGSDLADKLW